ncbi:MAG TPA: hypothetical protein VNJ10_10870 [Sphingomonas sp.]|nr:hypothetical protein [Sphingomonas sp.]
MAAGVSSQATLTQAIAALRAPVGVAPERAGSHGAVVTVSNSNAFPVMLDVPIDAARQAIEADGQAVGRNDGIVTWSPLLPPGGKAELRYRY